MDTFNNPTAILLWLKDSPAIEMINAKFHEQYSFETDPDGVPDDLKGTTCVEISRGAVRSFVGSNVNRSIWRDPLDEQDLVLVTDATSTGTYQQCRELLNSVCPVKTNCVVTFTSQANAELEAGFRVFVAAALERDMNALDSNVEVYPGRRIVGRAGITLGIAAEFDRSAFCIVIEHAPDAQFISSSAVKAAMLAFNRVTAVEVGRGQMSERTIQMRRHLRQVAEERNRNYREIQSVNDACGGDNSYFESARSIEDELRLAENVQWIEQLFDGIGEDKDNLNHSRKVFLKSELDRLGLFSKFKERFLNI